MLKLMALNYAVMLNGYSQWLNIRGGQFAFSHKKDAIKQTLTIYCFYVVSTLIWRLNMKLLQYKSIFKNLNVRLN